MLTLAACAGGWAGFVVVGRSWASLGLAAFLGTVSAQLGLLGHDAGHGQIFESRRANRLLGLALGNGLIGLSFGWWAPKHTAHHAHPNEVGRDPDVRIGLVGAGVDGMEGTGQLGALAGWLARHQAALFVPLMLLRSTGRYVSGAQDLVRRRTGPRSSRACCSPRMPRST